MKGTLPTPLPLANFKSPVTITNHEKFDRIHRDMHVFPEFGRSDNCDAIFFHVPILHQDKVRYYGRLRKSKVWKDTTFFPQNTLKRISSSGNPLAVKVFIPPISLDKTSPRSSFFTIFSDVSNVPLSSYCFDEFYSTELDQIEELKRKFLTVLGKLLLQANVKEGDCDKALAVLKMIPNLSKLTMQGPDLSTWVNPSTGFTQVGCEDRVLPNLKILELHHIAGTKEINVDFVEFLPKTTQSKIRHFEVHNLCLSISSAGRLAALLDNIPFIAISTNYLQASESSLHSKCTNLIPRVLPLYKWFQTGMGDSNVRREWS